uniref:CSON008616 protein n=1 Tax=Culicoides sonorensis TaxID=179676 RepID=A0A336KDI2_CULSO
MKSGHKIHEIKDNENENSKKIEHKCPECSKKFIDAFRLERHIKRNIHKKSNNNNIFECPHCPKRYERKYCLNRHIKISHSNQQFTCDTCGRTFNQKSAIEIHLRRHLKDYEFECDLCSKMFVTKAALKAHIKNMHLLKAQRKKIFKFFCSYCNKGFTQRYNCLIHEIRNHKPSEAKHACFCGRAYATIKSYEIHLKTHLPMEYREKYICEICNKILLSSKSLEQHKETHQDKRKRVRCTSCRSDFANKLLMKRHMREVHFKIKRIVRSNTFV